MKLKTNYLDMVLINVHAPTEDKDGDEAEVFYATLEDVYESLTGSSWIIVDDFNAKIGREILRYRSN